MRIERTEAFLTGFRAIRDTKARAAIAVRLDRLAAGNPGDVRPVGDGVSELRVHVGAGWRVYFSRRGVELVILLCVGSKTSQEADILEAKRLATDVKRRDDGRG